MSIFGISWFWFVGATLLAQFPIYTKSVLGGDETVVTLLLATFSIGIGLGSLLCNRLLKGVVSATYVPLSAFLISIFGFDLFWVSHSVPLSETLISMEQFFQNTIYLRVLIDLTLIAVAGGLYVVPLFAILQKEADEKHKSRTIAANNIINALFMVGSAILCITLFASGYSVLDIFLLLFVLNTIVGIYICQLLPQTLLKTILQYLRKLFHSFRQRSCRNISKKK